MSHVHAFPMHSYSPFNIFDIFVVAWDSSDCSSLVLPLNSVYVSRVYGT